MIFSASPLDSPMGVVFLHRFPDRKANRVDHPSGNTQRRYNTPHNGEKQRNKMDNTFQLKDCRRAKEMLEATKDCIRTMCKMKFKRLTDAKRLVLFTEEDTQEMNDDEKKRMKDNLASIDEDSVTFMNENGKEEKPVMMKDMSSEELLMIVGWIDSPV